MFRNLFIVLFVGILQACLARDNLFCTSSKRCLGGLGRQMYIGEQGTAQCNTKCVWIPPLYPNYECGECAPSGGNTEFSIDIDVPGDAEADIAYFYNATNYWETVITQGIPDKWVLQESLQVALSPLRGCGWRWAVDDLFICMTYADYAFDIVAISAPYIFRASGSQLPAVGLSQINSNFVDGWKADGSFVQRLQREIGFVMGIGSMWERKGLVKDCEYVGSSANAAYKALSGGKCNVPIDSHTCEYFDDTCLGDEMFAATPDGALAVSSVSLAALQDLGYEVNTSKAESISVTSGCCGSRRHRKLSEEKLRRAQEAGREILLEQAAQPSLPEGFEYASFVKVTMIQDGELHDVIVRSKDVLA